MKRKVLAAGSLLLFASTACPNNEPILPPCTAAGAAVSLSVTQYVSENPTPAKGCTVFPASPGASREYLAMAQIATGEPGQNTSFRLLGDTIRPALMAAPPIENSIESSPASEFHAFLRRNDHDNWRAFPIRELGPERPFPPLFTGPPNYGESRTFQVCGNLTCSRFQTISAIAKAVKSNLAIFVDLAAPGGGLDSTTLDGLATQFDEHLYPVDTAAFGSESDIDGNGVVLVLMTPVVNKLVTAAECQKSGYVAGFFYGLDLLPSQANSNAGELFYSMVPDPDGSLSCPHSNAQVIRDFPLTVIHEFQHMISFNQHAIVRPGAGEILWLNEGFSHYAEELGGWHYGAGTPQFSAFNRGNVRNAYQYLDSTAYHYLTPVAGIGSLAERGAAWLFVRFLVDQYSAGSTMDDWNVVTRKLVATTEYGWENIETVTGDPFESIATRWALANYVSDLPGFTAPPELQYKSWAFRTTYALLHTQEPNNFPETFPLNPTQSDGRSVLLQGKLFGGSGVYHLVEQPGDDRGFTLHFTDAEGRAIQDGLKPRLNLIRIR
jgi:hypothetical protein